MAKVTLTKEEMARAYYLGIKIYNHKKELKIKNNKIGSKEGPEYNIQGVSGEMAVFKYLDIPFIEEIFDISDKQDLLVKGYKFNIKTNNYMGVPENDRFSDDGFIFVKHDKELREFEIQGVISTKKFLRVSKRNGRWLNAKEEDLEDIDKLYNFLHD